MPDEKDGTDILYSPIVDMDCGGLGVREGMQILGMIALELVFEEGGAVGSRGWGLLRAVLAESVACNEVEDAPK